MLNYYTNPNYNIYLKNQQDYFRRSQSVPIPYQNLNHTHTKKEKQKLLITRHGERVDSYYGPGWIQSSFTLNGQYIRTDKNMPITLIKRENPYEFEFDPPLTENGLLQAKIHGEELLKAGVKITHMYSSPALRSIQTADKILEGMGLKDKVPIHIEPGLFELLSWQKYVPMQNPFIDILKLKEYGYNIDLNYRNLLSYENLKKDESIVDFYYRSYYITKNIVDKHSTDGGNVCIVAHAPSLEGCSRLLTGEYMRSLEEFLLITRKIPFLSIAQCEKDNRTGRWRLIPLLTAWQKHQTHRSRLEQSASKNPLIMA